MKEEPDKLLDRETLYEEVWTEPVTVVAERYGLSDVGLAKICKKLSIPVPSRGYWAMLKAGRIMRRVPLPKLGDKATPRINLTKLTPEQSVRRVAAKEQSIKARKSVHSICVPNELTDPHPLVKAASKRLKQRDGWSDKKGLRSVPEEVLHIEVTDSALDRALRVTDTLIKELAKLGVTIQIDGEHKRTLLVVEETTVTLMISEYVRRTNHEETPAEKKARDRYHNNWRLGTSSSYPHIPQYDYHPTGVLTITVWGWPSRTWKDTPRTSLENRLGEVVPGILALAMEVRDRKAEEARKEEIRRCAAERYQRLKQQRENERALFRVLEREAKNWQRASRLRDYIDVVERRAASTGEWPSGLQDWIAWARAKADWIDPLILVSDPILDAPEPKQPGYYW